MLRSVAVEILGSEIIDREGLRGVEVGRKCGIDRWLLLRLGLLFVRKIGGETRGD